MANFEFETTIRLNPEQCHSLEKKVAKETTKETARLVVKQKCFHGELICELGRAAAKKNAIAVKSRYLFFMPPGDDTVVDYRTSTLPSKEIRASCRPNTTVKPVLIGPNDTRWFLFSVGNIDADSELFLPSDFENGNNIVHRKCVCSKGECCLFETVPEDEPSLCSPQRISLKEYMLAHPK